MKSSPLRFTLLVRLAGTIALAGCGSPPTPVASGATLPAAPSALDRLVSDVCGKQVVLLGEPGHHGSGPTLQAKVELVKRLTDECQFSALFMESGLYDFIDLEHSLAAGTATREQLGDAIIVWCATIHAAKDLRGITDAESLIPLGSYLHRDFGDRAAAIGFSAQGGSELARLGTIAGRAMGETFSRVPWAQVVDGMVVFREEHPPMFVRGTQPQRAK